MGTITARSSKSGLLRDAAQIRIQRNGWSIHCEAKTFGTKTAAREWLRNRETTLIEQLADDIFAGTQSKFSSNAPNGRHQLELRPESSGNQTLALLLAEFGTGQIPLEKYCDRFGMNAVEAKRAAARQALPIPTFRLGSQKLPWLVSAVRLAEHSDAKNVEAESAWRRTHPI